MVIIAERPRKTVYRDGDRCIKTFDESFSKADILNEALNQARVEETGLNIPRLRGVTTIDGRWAIEYDFIEGKTLAQLMEENPDKLDEYLNDFIDLQLKMHAERCPSLGKLKDKMARKLKEADLDDTTRYDLEMRLNGLPTHAKLCHGDFNPSNIIVRPDGEMFIIDWSHATQGNASADAARTYLLFYLAEKFDLAEKYLDKFCFKSHTAKPYVQKWMPIVAASQSVKGNPEEREFLLSWASVVEY
ncbi:MAG: phosphotransferase [Oscillospiraceae bacterium]|nr:phosphotransferase [Oscillospiraceae bacterium]MBQ5504173.1 phosphotransferase [Oscillospiraceae bacterium]MBQ5514982.1 phosphotransferase [Oscillospiraceae bacterium]